MQTSLKQITVILVLLAFLAITFFGFATMVHGADGSMPGDCPLSIFGDATLCPQNTLAVVVHHISAYNSFLNVPVHFGLNVLFAALALIAYLFFAYSISPPSFDILLSKTRLDSARPASFSSQHKETRWLSLLEHSPATL